MVLQSNPKVTTVEGLVVIRLVIDPHELSAKGRAIVTQDLDLCLRHAFFPSPDRLP